VKSLQERLPKSAAPGVSAPSKMQPTAAAPNPPSRPIAYEKTPKLTAPVYKLSEEIDQWDGKCVYLDEVWIDGKPDPNSVSLVGQEDGLWTLEIRDSRGERYIGLFGTRFACSKTLADQWREKVNADASVKAKICCAISAFTDYRGKTRALARVYRIGIYNMAGEVMEWLEEKPLSPASPSR